MIGYNFSGEWTDYNNLLRKFRLDSLLKDINEASNAIFNRSSSSPGNGVIATSLKMTDAKTRVQKNHDVFVAAWTLIDLAYHAIISTNDYRGKEQLSDDDLKLLCAAESGYHEKQEHPIVEKTKDTPDFMFYLWGFAGEQFKVQQTARIFDNAARDLYILLELAPKIGFNDLENIVANESGVTWNALSGTLFLLWVGFSKGQSVEGIKRMTRWDDKFTSEDFQKVVDRYTASYEEIRKSELKRQIFYAKPYVCTERTKEIVSVSTYLDLFIYEHAVLWTIRDNYNNRGSQQFTSDFGKMFEEYFHELLSTYLKENDFGKIPEDKTTRADWRVNLCGHKFIVEQKSTILRLAAKQQNSEYSAMNAFATKTVIKALNQLKSTENKLKFGSLTTNVDEKVEDQWIKVILLYDDYLNDNLLDAVFQMAECDVTDDYRYWLMTIDEMECLLSLYSTEQELCKTIVEEKLELDAAHGADCSSISYLLSKHGYDENVHMHQGKLKYYRDYTVEFIREHLPRPKEGASS